MLQMRKQKAPGSSHFQLDLQNGQMHTLENTGQQN